MKTKSPIDADRVDDLTLTLADALTLARAADLALAGHNVRAFNVRVACADKLARAKARVTRAEARVARAEARVARALADRAKVNANAP